ncbi:MAG: D-alanyl-D-alanine carboxypeptidase/D-alanyl-D-alanine-endopeptidase [Myxococcota bacterium]
MLRSHRATVLLALAALWGAETPAAAESRRLGERAAAPRGLDVAPDPLPAPISAATSAGSVPASSPTVPRTDAEPSRAETEADPDPDMDPDMEPDAWVRRIEARLLNVEQQAHELAADRLASTPDPALVQRLETLASSLPRSAALGIAVRDLATGAPVFEWQEHEALNPASNQKLLAAAAALELLGADYRWQTRVLRAGDALVVVGEGDPSLQVADLRALAEQIATRVDLSTIRRIIVDDTAFSARRLGPGYSAHGPGASYMAPSGALSLQWNTVEVWVRGAAPGRPVSVSVSPPCGHVTVRSSATGARGQASSVTVHTRAEAERTVVEIRGRLAASQRIHQRRRIGDPGRFTGSTLATLLRAHGALALPVELGPTPPQAEPVVTHRSAPLPEVLRTALSYSNNFASEQVLRTLGWRMTGEPGDWTNGRLALRRYWAAAGLPLRELVFENASGLSTRGRVTASGLADLLAFATRPGSDAAVLPEVLPRAGTEGTLRGRLRRAADRVHAKTGTLAGASALTGVAQTKGGPRVGFSILVGGPVSASRSRRLQDQVVMALVDHDATG